MSVPSICISSLLEQKAISMALEFAGLSARAALDVVSSAWCCVLLDAAHWSRAPGRSSWRIWNPLSVCWKRQRWHYGASGWTEDKEQGHRRLWGTMDWLFQHLFRVWNVGKNPNCPLLDWPTFSAKSSRPVEKYKQTVSAWGFGEWKENEKKHSYQMLCKFVSCCDTSGLFCTHCAL